ncbi:hypothetical protein [Candidatus Binatus sp.]|uniref:hypothetical protein n=1 Tax=Candidatus Binatus sp. TaxID=2811406 RepID=UPI003C67448E
MPGHSLYRIRKRWRFVHDGGFIALTNVIPQLHKRFLVLGSKHKPRAYKAGGIGLDQDVKQILSFEGGILEALQRWRTDSPKPVYDPVQGSDYDQIAEFLVELIRELRSKKNRIGLVSQPWTAPPLPAWHDDTQSKVYDQWLLDRAIEFREELRLKPTIKRKFKTPAKTPGGSLGPVSDVLNEVLDLLSTAQP